MLKIIDVHIMMHVLKLYLLMRWDITHTHVHAHAHTYTHNRYGNCNASSLVVGLIYPQRLKHVTPRLNLNSYNIQRLYLVAVMTAAKFLEVTLSLLHSMS